MNAVKKIYTDGRVEEVDEKMSLEQMQKFVGGYIEIAPSRIARRSLVFNEDGISLNLPANAEATKYAHPHTLIPAGGIRGNVLLVKK